MNILHVKQIQQTLPLYVSCVIPWRSYHFGLSLSLHYPGCQGDICSFRSEAAIKILAREGKTSLARISIAASPLTITASLRKGKYPIAHKLVKYSCSHG